MNILQTTIQTIAASIIALGWLKTVIVVVIICIISKYQPLLGLVAALLFLAYLVHWI